MSCAPSLAEVCARQTTPYQQQYARPRLHPLMPAYFTVLFEPVSVQRTACGYCRLAVRRSEASRLLVPSVPTATTTLLVVRTSQHAVLVRQCDRSPPWGSSTAEAHAARPLPTRVQGCYCNLIRSSLFGSLCLSPSPMRTSSNLTLRS